MTEEKDKPSQAGENPVPSAQPAPHDPDRERHPDDEIIEKTLPTRTPVGPTDI